MTNVGRKSAALSPNRRRPAADYPRAFAGVIRPTALVPRKHIGSAGEGAAGGTERSADNRADGTAGFSPSCSPGGLAGHCTRYRVPIPQMVHRLADAMAICVARHTAIFRHRRARRTGRYDSGGKRQNREPRSHLCLREKHTRPRRSPPTAGSTLCDRILFRVLESTAGEATLAAPVEGEAQ